MFIFIFLWWSPDTFYPRVVFITFPVWFFLTSTLRNIFYTCNFAECATCTTVYWRHSFTEITCLDAYVQLVLLGISFYTCDFPEHITYSTGWWTHSLTEITLLWLKELLALLETRFKYVSLQSVTHVLWSGEHVPSVEIINMVIFIFSD